MRRLAARILGGARLTRRGGWLFGTAVVLGFAAYAGGRPMLLLVASFLAALPVIAFVVVRSARNSTSCVRPCGTGSPSCQSFATWKST